MANGYSQGIGSITGLRKLRKSKLDFHHFLYLLFIASPVAGYLLLYLSW
jgi:hypothetical protein